MTGKTKRLMGILLTLALVLGLGAAMAGSNAPDATVEPTGAGVVTKSQDGSNPKYEAAANSGYAFANWEYTNSRGSHTSASNPITFDLAPDSIQANFVQAYPLWVGKTQVTVVNASDVFGDGKVSYDATTDTLTLNGAKILTGYKFDADHTAGVYYNGAKNLKIVLEGYNRIENTTEALAAGIYSGNNMADVAVSGEGALAAYGFAYGIYSGKSISISSGTVRIDAGKNGQGIFAIKDVIVDGGAVSIKGNRGLYSSEGNITINGGEVYASECDDGVYIHNDGDNIGNVVINGGNVTLFGTHNGIYAKNNVTVTAGIVNVTGGNEAILASQGIVKISGGTVIAKGNGDNSYGIYSAKDVVIRDGEIDAEGKSMGIGGSVKNAIAGTGWTNTAGTEGGTAIAVSTEGQDLGSYKKVQFPVMYPLWVGGTQVTSENASNITGGDPVTASYNAETHILTLNNANITTGKPVGGPVYGIYYAGSDNLAIHLTGDNSVIGTERFNCGIGINGKGALTISGSGSLRTSGSAFGITAGQTIKIESGSITASADNLAITSDKDLEISGGTVKATGSNIGIYSWSSIKISGGEVTAAEGKHGIYSSSIEISGGTVNVSGSDSGIKAETDILIANNCQVVAAGNTALDGNVKNAIAGTGWTDTEGKQGRADIAVSETGQTLSFKKVQFPSDHVHKFTGTVNGATLTAACTSGCPDGYDTNPATLTIKKPTLTTYGQTGEGISASATLDGTEAFNTATGASAAETGIQYFKAAKSGETYTKDGDALGAAPTGAGEYVAEISVTIGNGKYPVPVGYTIAPAAISSVAVTGITAPEATKELDPAATATEHVTLDDSGAITWTPAPADGKAAYATEYNAAVTVVPDENYAFAETVTATINEKTAVVTKNDDGTIDVAYAFPKTALIPVDIAAADKEAAYSAEGIAIPVNGMFTVPEGAGSAILGMTQGTGEGTLDGGKLKVTKCGTFTISIDTAETDTHAAGNAGATLTVVKAASPVTVTETAAVAAGGKTVDLSGNVALNGAAGAVSYAISGEAKGCTLKDGVLTSGDEEGTVTVNVTVAEDAFCNALAATPITVTISDKQEQTITAEDVTAAYGDIGKAIKATTNGDGEISYALKSGDAVTVNASTGALAIVKAGTAVVTVTASETDSYLPAAKDVKVTVAKKEATVTAENKTKAYDNDASTDPALTAVVTGAVGGDKISYTLSRTAGQDAKEYAITVTVGENPNYEVKGTNGVFTITKAKAAVAEAPEPMLGMLENDEPMTLVTAGKASGGTMQYALGTDDKTTPEKEWSEKVPAGMKAGTYYVWYKAQGDGNHTDSVAACVIAKIAKLPEPGPGPEPEPGPGPEPEPTNKILLFVRYCYNMILGREADEAGENYWFSLLSEEKISTTEAVSGFIFSGEFAGKSLNTRQQMAVVGETMETNQEDLSTWSAALEQGSTLAEAINGLGASNEFDDLRSRFDFDSDYASSEDLRTDLIQLRAFVARCYDAFLGREADDAGMNAWAEPFASGKKTAAEIIAGFVFSEEFEARYLSTEEIVKALYRVMLNRTADEAGLAQWVTALDNGEPLESVINGIAQSDEFIQICKACGIRPGFLPVGPEPAPEPEPEDQWDEAKITAFIRRAYREGLDRIAGGEELAHWVSQVMSKEISPAKAARMILASQEMEARSLGNEAFVKVMYKVFLDRDADPDGVAYWQAKLEGEEALTRVALMREFCNSKEYKDYQETLKK